MTKFSSSKPIRIITIQIQTTIPDERESIGQQDIVDYLNGKLLENPDFWWIYG